MKAVISPALRSQSTEARHCSRLAADLRALTKQFLEELRGRIDLIIVLALQGEFRQSSPLARYSTPHTVSRLQTQDDRLSPSRCAVGQRFAPHLFEIVVRPDLGP